MPIHVEGIEDCLEKFDAVLTRMLSPTIVHIFQLGGEFVRDRAKQIVHKDTGELADAIFARAYRRDNVPYVLVGVESKEPAHGHAVVPHGAFLEFGTEHNKAYPFLRPAIDETKNEVVSIIATALEQLLGE